MRDQIKKTDTSARFHIRYYTIKFDKKQQETWGGQINYTSFHTIFAHVFFWEWVLRKPAEFVGFWWEKVYKKNQGF